MSTTQHPDSCALTLNAPAISDQEHSSVMEPARGVDTDEEDEVSSALAKRRRTDP